MANPEDIVMHFAERGDMKWMKLPMAEETGNLCVAERHADATIPARWLNLFYVPDPNPEPNTFPFLVVHCWTACNECVERMMDSTLKEWIES